MKLALKYTLLASVVAVTPAAQAEVNVVSWGVSGRIPINPLFVYTTNGCDLPAVTDTIIL